MRGFIKWLIESPELVVFWLIAQAAVPFVAGFIAGKIAK